MKELELEIAPFEAWLKERHDERVGAAQSDVSCPIAQYLKFRGAKNPNVYRRYSSAQAGRDRASLTNPKWAQCFIEKTDKNQAYSEILGSEALEYLEECKEEK